MEELAERAAANDAEAVTQAAHALKSMSVNIGASRLVTRLARIEREARRDAMLPGAEEVAALEALLVETIAALQGLFDRATIVQPPEPQRSPTRAAR